MNSRLARQFFLLLLIWLPKTTFAATAIEQIESSVHHALQQFVAAQAAEFGRRVEYSFSSPDPRLTLPLCSIPPRADFDSTSVQSRLSVKVSCDGQHPWSLYVPVQLRAWQAVVTAATALQRGQKIDAADLILTEVDVSNLRYGYFAAPQEVVGQQVKRSLSPGEALYPNMLERPLAVQRGDEVMIRARSQQFSVQMQGTALNAGKIGQQISVRNLSSQRIVRATVIAQGIVEVQI